MKLQVILNTTGDVLGTARFEPVKGGPTTGGIIPEAGQVVREVDVPDELVKLPADQLHAQIKSLLPTLPG